MKPKVYFPDELIETVLGFVNALKAGGKVLHPVNVNDLVIFDTGYDIDRKTFIGLMDLYFEYETVGNDSSLFLITGLKEIVI